MKRKSYQRPRPVFEAVLIHLAEEGGVWTAAGIAEVLGLPVGSVKRSLRELVAEKQAKIVGKRAQSLLHTKA